MESQKVLITGGAGYIGSVLTKHLLEKGHSVICLDDLRYRQTTPVLFVDNSSYEFVFGDVRDEKLVGRVLSGKDFIIPLAAIVGMPACDRCPRDATTINQEAIAMLDRLRDKNQKVIYPTTNSGYGVQTGEVFCTEETPLTPISLYGVTKAEAERILLESKKPAITLRLATVFGISPRMRMDLLVNDFVKKAVEDKCLVLFEKDFKRNYVHIRDIARCFEHCMTHFESMQGTMYNVGLEDANLSKLELAERIKLQIPDLHILEAQLGKDPDKRNYIVSNKKIMATGFKTTVSLDDGIRELIRGYNILLKNNSFKNV